MNQSVYKISLVIIILLLSSLTNLKINAQTGYTPIIYKAYISGDMNKWASVIYTIEKQNPSSVDAKLELISYYYGYTAFLIGTKKYDTAQKYLERAEKHIEELLKLAPNNATAYAFKGSFIGFRIGMSKFKAVSLGPESSQNLKRSLEIDPHNIQGNVDKANALYYTPKLFGGSKVEALKMLKKATILIEKSGNTSQNWFYINVLTLTAQTYDKLNQLQQAKAAYEKIIRFEPDYKWVKNELYPELLKRM